jgi:chromosome segregation protein
MKNELETINKQINQMTLSSSLLKNNIENINIQFQKLTLEKDRFEIEKKEKTINLEKLNEEKKEIEIELTTLRNKENVIIQSFNSTYTKLQEYDNKIKKISENERRLTKELNHIEKETAIIKKDIIELENRKINLTKELNDLGYKETLENFEIENLYQEIREELETIKDKINLRADETYLEIIDGYRGMSNKRNQLEEERNSIVNFIEEIGKEKENVFSNAFEKVDEDIRKTFSEITGGNAWLEFENPENIFSGGILLMVQFPNKPARESTSLSGGEKTMAAIVFLLALQSLKP